MAPVYNEGTHIYRLVKSWHEYIRKCEVVSSHEIVLVNDGSTDNTWEEIRRLNCEIGSLKTVNLKSNGGAARALRIGIRTASMQYTLLMDADGQFRISYLESMISEVLRDAETFVIGRRLRKEGCWASIGSFVSGKLLSWCYNADVPDFNSAFKLAPTLALQDSRLEAVRMNYSLDITAKLIDNDMLPKSINVYTDRRLGGVSSSKILITSYERVLFVAYLIFRRFLLNSQIIEVSRQR